MGTCDPQRLDRVSIRRDVTIREHCSDTRDRARDVSKDGRMQMDGGMQKRARRAVPSSLHGKRAWDRKRCLDRADGVQVRSAGAPVLLVASEATVHFPRRGSNGGLLSAARSTVVQGLSPCVLIQGLSPCVHTGDERAARALEALAKLHGRVERRLEAHLARDRDMQLGGLHARLHHRAD